MIRRAIPAIAVAACLWASAGAVGAPGDLDASFGPGGRVSVNVENSRNESPAAVLRDSMGRLLVVGSADVDGTRNILVQRILPTGAPDATWESFHRYPLTSAGAWEVADAVLDGSGNLVIAGTRSPPGSATRIFVMRLTSAGIRDGTFGGGDGWVDEAFTAETEQPRAVALQPDGRILVAGYVTSGATGTRRGGQRGHGPAGCEAAAAVRRTTSEGESQNPGTPPRRTSQVDPAGTAPASESASSTASPSAAAGKGLTRGVTCGQPSSRQAFLLSRPPAESLCIGTRTAG